MLAPSHLVAAQTSYLLGCLAFGHQPAVFEASISLLAGLLPDLDHRRSLLGRYVPWLAGPLEHRFGHRTITHSLALQVALLLPAFLILPFGYALALCSGWVSHVFGDMMTEGGVCWFWPGRARCVLPGNERYRFSLLSWSEMAFASVLALAGLGCMTLIQVNAGTAGLVRAAIGSIAAAREQYDAEKGTHAYRLRIEGRDNRGYQAVDGEYPVIGEWQAGGFILQAGERFVSACKSEGCDWHTDKAVLVAGDPQITTTTHHKGKAVSVATLREALQAAQGAGSVYLVGEAGSDSIKPAPPILLSVAGKVELHFLPAAQLSTLPDATLRDFDLSVQVRHPPGTVAPQVNIPDQDSGQLDPLLQRWL